MTTTTALHLTPFGPLTHHHEVDAARGQTDGPFPDLGTLTQKALRCVLPASQPTRARDEELGKVLRNLCDRARDARLQAEAVVILLKDAWYQLPENARNVHDHAATLARVVTLCIEEYYSVPASRFPSPASS